MIIPNIENTGHSSMNKRFQLLCEPLNIVSKKKKIKTLKYDLCFLRYVSSQQFR